MPIFKQKLSPYVEVKCQDGFLGVFFAGRFLLAETFSRARDLR
jgi:hypothetical protein